MEREGEVLHFAGWERYIGAVDRDPLTERLKFRAHDIAQVEATPIRLAQQPVCPRHRMQSRIQNPSRLLSTEFAGQASGDNCNNYREHIVAAVLQLANKQLFRSAARWRSED